MITDPDIRIPSRPRISRDLLFIPMDKSVQVRGAEDPVVLSGVPAVDWWRRILDGKHSMPEISSELLYLSRSQVEDRIGRALTRRQQARLRRAVQREANTIVTKLYMNGLLQDGPPPSTNTDVEPHAAINSQVNFISRYVDVTRVSKNESDAQALLARARVLTLTTGHIGRSLREALGGVGVGVVDHLDLADYSNQAGTSLSGPVGNGATRDLALVSALKAQTYDLTVMATCRPMPRLASIINREAITARTQLLFGWIDGHRAVIGPLVIRGDTACWACVRGRQLAASTTPDEDLAYETALDGLTGTIALHELPLFSEIAGRVLALEVFKILTMLFMPVTGFSRVLVLDAQTSVQREHRVYRLPGCSVCGGRNAIEADDPYAGYIAEEGGE